MNAMVDESKSIDFSKFQALEDLVTLGRKTTTAKVGTLTLEYRTLNHDEEAEAMALSNTNFIRVRVEQLVYAITKINGKKIESEDERAHLRKVLGKLPSSFVNELYLPYSELSKTLPKLSADEVEQVLGEDPNSGLL